MPPHKLQNIAVPALGRLHNQHGPGGVYLNMQLLGPAVDIHQKQIVQKQILDKIVLVQPLLVCRQQHLHLECGHLADGIHIFPGAPGHQNILQLLIKDLKKLISLF